MKQENRRDALAIIDQLISISSKENVELLKKLRQCWSEMANSNIAENLKVTYKNISDIIWVIDEETKFTFISPSVEKSMGYNPKELIGTSVLEYMTEDHRNIAAENIQKRSSGEKDLKYEYTEYEMVAKNGRIVPVEVNANPLWDAEGKLEGFAGVTRIITARKEIEKALHKNEQKLKFLAHSALEMTTLESESEVFSFVANTVYEIQDRKGIVIATELDEAESQYQVKAMLGLGKTTQKIIDLLGIDPETMSGKITHQELTRPEPGVLTIMGSDISHLSHGRISPFVTKQLKKLLGIVDVGVISFTKQEKKFGSISILATDKHQKINKDFIEAFISQISVFLHRKQVLEALRLSEEKYRLLMDNAGVGIGYYDLDGNLILFNNTAAKIMGGSPEEFTGKSVFDLYGSKQGNIYVKRIKEAAESRERLQYEDEFITASGTSWFISTYSCVYNQDGSINGVQIVSHDITQRKHAELARAESEQWLQNIINHSDNMFFIHDTEHVLSYVSPQSLKIFGYLPHEMKLKWTELITDHPINVKGIQYTEKAINTGQSQPAYPLQVRTKDGDKRWIEVYESPVKGNNRKVVSIVGAIRDITEQKTAHDALAESELRYRSLFERSSDPNMILEGTLIIDANEAAAKELGFAEPSELIGLSPIDFSPEYQPDGKKSVDAVKQIVDVAYRMGYKRFEWVHLTKNGEHVWYDISLTKIMERGVERLHIVLRNIDEIKSSQEKLKRINYILEETGKIAHVGGWEFDVETGKGNWTAEVARIHDVDPDEPTNREKGLKFYKGESRKKIEQAIHKLITEKKPYDLELVLHTDKGNTKWIRTIGHPVVVNGVVRKAFGSFQDITAQKNAEIEIKKYRDHLEEIVEERTKKLEESNAELERMNNLFVGREFRIKSLRDQVKRLNEQLKNKIE